jgi:DNA-binding FadR family transcriptional regulator
VSRSAPSLPVARQDEAAALAGLRQALGHGGPAPHGDGTSAYEQVARRLRTLIVDGRLRTGARLPTEASLASELGVSRATVREALRILAAEGLLVATRGARGGTYVTRPSLDFASRLLQTNVALLAELDDITLEELLEARELIEIPAARLAARRRGDEDLDRLAAAIPDDAGPRSADARWAANAGFHASLVDAAGNALLAVSALPVFTVLQTGLARASLSTAFDRRIDADHRAIADAIARRDEDGAGEAMASHLAYLRPHYRRVWRVTQQETRRA